MVMKMMMKMMMMMMMTIVIMSLQVLREAVVMGMPRTRRPWKKVLVVVEGIYSMEGEVADLGPIVKVAKKHKVSSNSYACFPVLKVYLLSSLRFFCVLLVCVFFRPFCAKHQLAARN